MMPSSLSSAQQAAVTAEQIQKTSMQVSKDESYTSSVASTSAGMMTSILDRLKTAAHDATSSWLWVLLLAFVAGVFTSFTPCVYPMIPITLGVLRANATNRIWYNMLTAAMYVFGISLVYASLGYFAATTSRLFGQWAGNPIVLGAGVGLFLYLAGAMFGWYNLYLPRFLQRNDAPAVQGSLLRAFLFGLVSGTIASPCLTPALALILTFAAKAENPLLGFFTLFSFSLGLGFLLLIIGTFSGSLSLLPRAGMWMMDVERSMGFMLLAVSVYLSEPWLDYVGFWLSPLLYAGIAALASGYFFVTAQRRLLKLLIACALALWTVFMMSHLLF